MRDRVEEEWVRGQRKFIGNECAGAWLCGQDVQHGWKSPVFRCPLHRHRTSLYMKRLWVKHRSSGGSGHLDHLPLGRAPSPPYSAELHSLLASSLTPQTLPSSVGPWQSPQPSAGKGDLPATLSAPRRAGKGVTLAKGFGRVLRKREWDRCFGH